MTTVEWAIAMAIVAAGACAQGSLGFGLGLPGLLLTEMVR